jgi:hypothetical protein
MPSVCICGSFRFYEETVEEEESLLGASFHLLGIAQTP